MDKEILRPLVFDVLRAEPRTSIHSIVSRIPRFAYPRNILPADGRAISKGSPHFQLTPQEEMVVREIIWDLLLQGMLTPGKNSSNPDFPPWCRVTDYGLKCLEEDRILPYDPDGYLAHLCKEIPLIDSVILMYVTESLHTFLNGNMLASTVMLGVASEKAFLLLLEALTNAFSDPNQKKDFEKEIRKAGFSIKRRFDVLRNKLNKLTLPPELADALDIQISGFFTTIRYSRNDAGHPTGRKFNRDEVLGLLHLFPGYCKRVYGLIRYFVNNPV